MFGVQHPSRQEHFATGDVVFVHDDGKNHRQQQRAAAGRLSGTNKEVVEATAALVQAKLAEVLLELLETLSGSSAVATTRKLLSVVVAKHQYEDKRTAAAETRSTSNIIDIAVTYIRLIGGMLEQAEEKVGIDNASVYVRPFAISHLH